jgi:Do/DeqQ family serine protease
MLAFTAFGPERQPASRGPVTVREEPAAPIASAPGTESYREAVVKATPSVVNIYTAKTVRSPLADDPLFRFFYGEQQPQQATSLGSGVIISEEGYVLTNNHVVAEADEIAIAIGRDTVAPAKIVGTDPETDLAVLKVSASGLRPITFGKSDALQVGDVVLAIGNPFGVGQTVTQGIVSATGRNRLGINTFENFIQTDAAINPGNSGGALIDARGNLVGINTAIFSQSGGSQGIGFAIPVSLARQVFSQIIEKGRVDRGWLGVSARDVAETATRGALIMGVQRGGPAERAGIRAGDLIVSVNGKLISDTGALINETAVLAPGTRATFSVLRDGKTLSIPVELGRRPPPARTGQTLPR